MKGMVPFLQVTVCLSGDVLLFVPRLTSRHPDADLKHWRRK